MGRKVKKRSAKAKAVRPTSDLDALRGPVLTARASVEAISDEVKAQVRKSFEAMTQAAREYHRALAPYREACRQAGVECEFDGGRPEDVKPNLIFIVDKVEKGVRVMVKGKPETEEVIPFAAIKASVSRAANAYTDKHVGPRERVGSRGATLAKRLRAVLAGKR